MTRQCAGCAAKAPSESAADEAAVLPSRNRGRWRTRSCRSSRRAPARSRRGCATAFRTAASRCRCRPRTRRAAATDLLVAVQHVLRKRGNCDRNTAPKNHIHEMPSSERKTTRLPWASFRFRQVSVNGFQLMRSSGSVDGDGGIALRGRAAEHRDGDAGQATAERRPRARDQQAAGHVPSRIATKVPISTMPLPPVSSRSPGAAAGRRTSPARTGSSAGPSGTRRRAAPARTRSQKPQPASSMIAISSLLTKRISAALSYLSASCPLVAENSRNGRMNSAPITRPASCGRQPLDPQLVGHHHGERELEQVVVAGAEELGPEERAEAALPQQRELVRMGAVS